MGNATVQGRLWGANPQDHAEYLEQVGLPLFGTREWNYIEPHVPAPKEHGRPRIHSTREILDAIFYVLRSGCQWCLLPHDALA